MKTPSWLSAFGLIFFAAYFTPASSAVLYNVLDFGADSSGKTISTPQIQSAIDACSRAGSGSVYFPAGNFLSGTLVLKSHVTLHLEKNARLLGSTRLQDYPVMQPQLRSYTDNYTVRSMIYAEKQVDIGIIGQGVIDGQGQKFPTVRLPYVERPYIIRMVECSHVTIRDVQLQNSAMWVQHYLACEHLDIEGIVVKSRGANYNNDGLDIDGCDHVTVAHCSIDSEDDAIVLKSTSARSCSNISISHCTLTSLSNAIKCGTESNGGFQNIRISDCHIYNTWNTGIALEIVDGGLMDGVIISNITMNKINNPLFIRLGNRARPVNESMEKPGMGSIQNIVLSNIIATEVGGYSEAHAYRNLAERFTGHVPSSITGMPGHPVKNVMLANIIIEYKGGGKFQDMAVDMQKKEKEYPEYGMFGQLPASGFYCRYVDHLGFTNVKVSCKEKDERVPLVCQDVADLFCENFTAPAAAGKKWYYGKNVTAANNQFARKP